MMRNILGWFGGLALLLVVGCADPIDEELAEILRENPTVEIDQACVTVPVTSAWVQCSANAFMAGIRQELVPGTGVVVREILCCPLNKLSDSESTPEEADAEMSE